MTDPIRDALDQLIRDIHMLAWTTQGVSGLYLNEAIAPWSDLLEGGGASRWLGDAIAAGRAALAAQPPAPAASTTLDLDALLSPEGAYARGTGHEDDAQSVSSSNGPEWWAPLHGCDTLDNLLDRIRTRILPHLRPPVAGIDVPGPDGDYGNVLDLCAAEGVDPRVGVPLLKRAQQAWKVAAQPPAPYVRPLAIEAGDAQQDYRSWLTYFELGENCGGGAKLSQENCRSLAALLRSLSPTLLRQPAPPPAPAPIDIDALLSPEGAYEPGTGQEDGAQLVDQLEWWAPQHGCETLDNLLDRLRARILPYLRPPIAGIDVPGPDGDYGDVIDLCAAEGVDYRVGVPLLKRAREAWAAAQLPTPASDGEREELAKMLIQEGGNLAASCNKIVNGECRTLACLQRGGYVRGDGPPDSLVATCPELEKAGAMRRAATLLRQPAPAVAPVPVAKRLPQAEDCSFNPGAEIGSCWCWNPPTYAGGIGSWSFEPLEWAEDATHWIPAYAIPQPPQVEEVA